MAYVLVDRFSDKPLYFLRTNRLGPFTIHVTTYLPEQARTYPTRSAAMRAAKSRRGFVAEPLNETPEAIED